MRSPSTRRLSAGTRCDLDARSLPHPGWRCSMVTSCRVSRSTPARTSARGSRPSGIASATVTPSCCSASRPSVPDDEALRYLEQWRQLAPYDAKVHRLLLNALARRGRVREAEEHLRAAVRLFEDEGLDCAPLHAAWLAARSLPAPASAGAGDRWSSHPARTAKRSTTPRRARASIAVMPFVEHSRRREAPGGTADALAYDVITRLAKLRNLFVIAQGTVFELKARGIGPGRGGAPAQRRLRDQRLRATRRRAADRHRRTGRSARRPGRLGRRPEAAAGGCAADARRDRQPHRRFDRERGRGARAQPRRAEAAQLARRLGVASPRRCGTCIGSARPTTSWPGTSSRPRCSSTRRFRAPMRAFRSRYFQSAFQGWAERASAVDRAFETAGQSLMADDRDPAAHWAMGRALWLRSRHEQCVAELEQAVELSPNFALGHYTLAFVHSQAGDPRAAIAASDYSRSLSPFDPLLFGMLGARAMALVRLGHFDEAARWAVQAAGRPERARAHPGDCGPEPGAGRLDGGSAVLCRHDPEGQRGVHDGGLLRRVPVRLEWARPRFGRAPPASAWLEAADAAPAAVGPRALVGASVTALIDGRRTTRLRLQERVRPGPARDSPASITRFHWWPQCSMGGQTMATYIVLSNFTDQGIRGVKDTTQAGGRSPATGDEVRRDCQGVLLDARKLRRGRRVRSA